VQVAEEISREGEVRSSNPTDRVAANFARKIPRLDRRALASRPLPRLKFFQVFFVFFISRFAERRALGKGFAEGLRGFAESVGPSAKQPAPVVCWSK
jgi:hypothetical protein